MSDFSDRRFRQAMDKGRGEALDQCLSNHLTLKDSESTQTKVNLPGISSWYCCKGGSATTRFSGKEGHLLKVKKRSFAKTVELFLFFRCFM